jgi:hypothetical protein
MATNRRATMSLAVTLGLILFATAGVQAENLALSTGPGATVPTVEIEQVQADGTLSTGYIDSSGWCGGPYFDLTAAAVAVRVLSFEMYFRGTVNRNVEVFWKVGTYVGSETNPSAWTSLGTVNVTPGGNGTLTPVNLGGVDIPPGATYGFKVWDGGTGGGDGPGLDLRMGGTTASDPNLSLISNAYTCEEPFNGLSTGFGWQGNVIYGDVPVELMSIAIE